MRKKMMGGGMMQRPMYKDGGKSKKSESKIISISVGVGKAKDYPGIKKIMEMNKKGKKKFSDGGSALKQVPTKNKGLKKLPTEVRNKMGFMQDGGKVENKKYDNKVKNKKEGAFGVSKKTDVIKKISKNPKKELSFDKTPKTNKFLKGFSPLTIARKIIAKTNKKD